MVRFPVVGLVLAIAAAACGSGAPTATVAPEVQRQADLYALQQIEMNFHKASATKDIDLMMSVWAENATATFGGVTLTGKDEIRDFFLKAATFNPENVWVSETPAWKLRSTVDGDTGTLYFECHFVDVATREVVLLVAQDTTVARINGVWLVTNLEAATAILSP